MKKSLVKSKIKKNLKITLAIIPGIFFDSCTRDEVIEELPDLCDSLYTYDADVSLIITTKCSNCHAPGGVNPKLTTFLEVVNSLKDVEEQAIKLKVMPPSEPLSNEEIKKISCWIEQGNPEN